MGCLVCSSTDWIVPHNKNVCFSSYSIHLKIIAGSAMPMWKIGGDIWLTNQKVCPAVVIFTWLCPALPAVCFPSTPLIAQVWYFIFYIRFVIHCRCEAICCLSSHLSRVFIAHGRPLVWFEIDCEEKGLLSSSLFSSE